MDGTKAVGIDGITKEEYGRNLEENLNALVERLKRKSYKPKPARLVEGAIWGQTPMWHRNSNIKINQVRAWKR